MGLIPNPMLAARRKLSERYLEGAGVELGALHQPLWTSERATVRYIDRLDVAGLRLQYPELAEHELVNVDIVDDGESLSSIEDGQLDFIIANHMLEHTENPIGTIRNHLRKLRDNGVLYYAVPDKWAFFDRDRPITPFEHLVRDDREGATVSRLEHFQEWVRLVDRRHSAGRDRVPGPTSYLRSITAYIFMYGMTIISGCFLRMLTSISVLHSGSSILVRTWAK